MANQQQPPKRKLNNIIRLSLFWAILVFSVLAIIAVTAPSEDLKSVPITDVIKRANEGKISKIEVQENDLKVTPKGEQKPTEKSRKEAGSSLTEQGLQQGKAEVTVVPPSETGNTIWNLAIIIIPVLIIVAFFMFMMRQAQGQNNQAMGFGKSKAKLYGIDK
jgi:cell division protease FtsH